MTVVVTEWRAAEAVMLQQALRMTNEAFAERLGAATRTVAKWRSKPQINRGRQFQARTRVQAPSISYGSAIKRHPSRP